MFRSDGLNNPLSINSGLGLSRSRCPHATIFSLDEIPHVWFHGPQTSGRNRQGNFRFEGGTIYSYAAPIGRKCEYRGRKYVLVTSREYSVTTNRHTSDVCRAIPGSVTVFRTYDVTRSPREIMDGYRTGIKEARAELAEAKNVAQRVNRFSQLQHRITMANRFAEFIGYKSRIPSPADAAERQAEADAYQTALVTRREIAAAKRRGANAERIAQMRAEQSKTLADRIAEWRVGGNFRFFGNNPSVPTLLRIQGDTVETTKGASFPAAHIARVLPMLERLQAAAIATAQPWMAEDSCPIRFATYRLETIEADGTIVAGCHRISPDESRRFAAEVRAWATQPSNIAALNRSNAESA